MDIKADLTWLQKHERMIIVFMVLLVGCFLGNKWINYDAAKKEAAYTALEQKLQEREKQDDINAKQTALVVSQYQEMVNSQERQIATLTGAIASRDAALKKKQEQVASMTLPQVAQEWETVLNVPHGTLSVSGVSVSVPEPQARQTVTQLERVGVLEQDLIDQTAITVGKQAELTSCTAAVSAQTAEIKGLKDTNVLQDQTCKAEVAKVKADGRKSKRNWFIAGFVAGIATRILVKF
jgi:hypothetical protein